MTAFLNVLSQPRIHPYLDSRGASISVETHGDTTTIIINVDGDIDASNADFVTTVLNGFATWNDAMVLDLGDLNFIGTRGLRVLLDFDDRCRRGDVAWAVVPCPMLSRLLQVAGVGLDLPVAPSVDDAVESLERDGLDWDLRGLTRVAADKVRC